MNEISIVFEYNSICYNQFSKIVPRIGESILIDNVFTLLIITDVIYDFTKKDIVYLKVKNK